MKTFILDWAWVVDPNRLAENVAKTFGCHCMWRDLNEDFLEFSVWGCSDLDGVADVLAEYA